MQLLDNLFLALVKVTPPGSLPKADANKEALENILEIVLGIVGALALLMVTVSGLRYILAGGDPQKAAQARNGIIYSLVGLAIAIAAQAIVVFVVKRV